MSKAIKDMIITALRDRVGENRDMLVVDSSKMDAFSQNKMRLKLQEQGITMLGVKNALARKALNDAGVSSLDPYLKGPSSLVFGSSDMVALTKIMAKWAKDQPKLELKGGSLDGQSLDSAGVQALSKSPGREELLGRVLMLIRSPGGKVAGALLGAGGKVAGQIKSIADKEGEAAEPAAG